MFYHGLFFSTGGKKNLDYDDECPYLSLAQCRTCPWVSAGPLSGEEIGMVPGTNRSSRKPGLPDNARTSEATTVRAFLVSSGFPSAGVTSEAHHHCRKCGRVLPPIHGRQSRIDAPGRVSVHYSRFERSYGISVSTGWFRSGSRRPLSFRALYRAREPWNLRGIDP